MPQLRSHGGPSSHTALCNCDSRANPDVRCPGLDGTVDLLKLLQWCTGLFRWIANVAATGRSPCLQLSLSPSFLLPLQRRCPKKPFANPSVDTVEPPRELAIWLLRRPTYAATSTTKETREDKPCELQCRALGEARSPPHGVTSGNAGCSHKAWCGGSAHAPSHSIAPRCFAPESSREHKHSRKSL